MDFGIQPELDLEKLFKIYQGKASTFHWRHGQKLFTTFKTGSEREKRKRNEGVFTP